MKTADKIATWIGLFLLFFVISIFPLIFLSSYFDMNLQGIGINITTIFKWNFIIAAISFLIFFIFQRLSSIKFFNFGVFNFLLAFFIGSILFATFGWVYFPHYNKVGFDACSGLWIKSGNLHTGNSGQINLPNPSWNEEAIYNLGQIDDFVRDNGKPTSITERQGKKFYHYWYETQSCTLQVAPSGTIENRSQAII